MGNFGRKAGSRAEAPGAADVFTAPERERIDALWRLTALPRAEFDATYGAMLGGFWRYAAGARGEAWTALRRETLVCAVAALRALAAYFGEGPSELRAIAEEAERRIGLPLDRSPAVSASASPPAEEAVADGPDAPEPQATPIEPAPNRTPPPAIGGEGAGWEWINWVRAGLRDGSVAVNAPGAWLHNIAGEAYVVSPACFETFAAGRDLAPATVRNRVVRLGRHRQRASPSGAANLFRAVHADGSRVGGMVFPGELIWDDDPPPRANASLVGRGR